MSTLTAPLIRRRGLAILALSLMAGSFFAAPPPTARAQTPNCQFTLGFQALRDLIPNVVGDCTTNEMHNPENGDGLQQTTNGLLVWRKADNWTAFTDGTTTWINGPFGLQNRVNSERFAWEPASAPVAAPTPAPAPPPLPRPPARSALRQPRWC